MCSFDPYLRVFVNEGRIIIDHANESRVYDIITKGLSAREKKEEEDDE